ncbi:MAG: Lrp/AsnC family transcriptional regulator, partial [Candidatus Hodarchaeales archaeon]
KSEKITLEEFPAVELDLTDKEILKILQKDSRQSIREIQKKLQDRNREIGERNPALALELKTSLGTIHNRLRKLESGTGVILGYSLHIDTERLGYDLTALIQIQIDVNYLEEVNQDLKSIPELIAVYNITGDYDLLCIGRFRNRRHLNKIIRDRITPNPYVSRTATSIALNILKEDFSAFLQQI